MVTPITIFQELQGLVHILPGTDPVAIASGIRDTLDRLAADDSDINVMRERLADFASQLSFERVAARLEGMCMALARENRSLARTYPASAPEFRRVASQIVGQSIIGTARNEMLRGPGVTLVPACYIITIEGQLSELSQDLPEINVELNGKPCAAECHVTMHGDAHFVWSAIVDVMADVATLDIVAFAAAFGSTRLDRMSIRERRAETAPLIADR